MSRAILSILVVAAVALMIVAAYLAEPFVCAPDAALAWAWCL